jgi:hypothetical protein
MVFWQNSLLFKEFLAMETIGCHKFPKAQVGAKEFHDLQLLHGHKAIPSRLPSRV